MIDIGVVKKRLAHIVLDLHSKHLELSNKRVSLKSDKEYEVLDARIKEYVSGTVLDSITPLVEGFKFAFPWKSYAHSIAKYAKDGQKTNQIIEKIKEVTGVSSTSPEEFVEFSWKVEDDYDLNEQFMSFVHQANYCLKQLTIAKSCLITQKDIKQEVSFNLLAVAHYKTLKHLQDAYNHAQDEFDVQFQY